MPVFCPMCDASNPTGAAFCGECGKPMTAAASADPEVERQTERATPSATRESRRRAKGNRAAASDRSPREHRHQVVSARRAVHWVRAFFVAVAAMALLVSGLLLLAWSRAGDQLEDEDRSALLVSMLLTAGVAAVALIGVARAQRNPLPWAIGAAGLLTLNVVAQIAVGQFPGLLLIVLTLTAWGTIAPVLRLLRLQRENPTDSNLQDFYREDGSRARTRNRKAWAGVGGQFRSAAIAFLVLLAAGAAVIYGSSAIARAARDTGPSAAAGSGGKPRVARPDAEVSPLLAQFESAWRASDTAAIGNLFIPRMRSKTARLGKTLERRGFVAPYPELRKRALRDDASMRKVATYSTPSGDIEIVLDLEDGTWGLVAFRFG